MGGKRRSSKHQGIRKNKKNANKQTLARVAERKEEQQVKLERKLADAEARIRTARLGKLGGVRKADPDEEAMAVMDLQYAENDENDERGKIIASKLENQQNAFEKLVEGLNHSVFDEALANGNKPSHPIKKAVSVERRPRVPPRKSHDDPVKHTPDLGAEETHQGPIPQEKIEDENHSAARRENAHFNSDLRPPLSKGEMRGLLAIPAVGKLSGMVDEELKTLLETTLKTDMGIFDASSVGMPPSIYEKWVKSLDELRLEKGNVFGTLTPLHRTFIAIMRQYCDFFLSKKLSIADEDMMRRLYVAHCFSHVIRCRGRVLRNHAATKNADEQTEDARDQGFSRARVLVLLPFKNVAYEVVKMLQKLAVGAEEGEKDVSHVANSERFESEFAPDPEESQTDIAKSTSMESSDSLDGIRTASRQSKEHEHVFRGNVDDDFKLGLSFSKKAMKLYTDFYDSDIIVASPLGLKRSLAEKASGQSYHAQKRNQEVNVETEWKTGLSAEREKPRFDDTDADFLSSIEICIIDGGDVFSMQNWDTLLDTMGLLNKMPANTRSTDFSRVRGWCLEGLMARFRQTILLCAYKKSEFVTLFRQLTNHAGKLQIVESSDGHGSISDVTVRMRQTFFKVSDVGSLIEGPEKRLSFFFEEVFPQIRALLDSQCLLIVPNYFDYVRVRNKLVKFSEEDSSFRFASMCEYSKGTEISRVRSRLFDRSISMVAMTERFHFFWRHWIRGANTIVWYGLPENCNFYPEILNMTAEAAESARPVQSMALYDVFDMHPLERIVGRRRCKKMITEDSRSTFLFV